jgi:UDP-N-acetylmuramyl pentapeptide synthase
MMTLAQAQALLHNRCELIGDGATEILRVHSDTRSLQAGDLFVALQGEVCQACKCLIHCKPWGPWPKPGARNLTCP